MNTPHTVYQLEQRLRQWVTARAKKDAAWQDVLSVIDYAKEKTPGYRDNGEPNFIHPLWNTNAAAAIIEACEKAGHRMTSTQAMDLIKITLCHDVLEDCPDVTREKLRVVIGERAELGVYNMSIKYYPTEGQLYRKTEDEYKREFLTDPLSQISKNCDRSHNLMTMINFDDGVLRGVVYDSRKQREKFIEVSEFYIPAGDPEALRVRFSGQENLFPFILCSRDAMVRMASTVFGEMVEYDYHYSTLTIDNPGQRRLIEDTIRVPDEAQVQRDISVVPVDFDAFMRGEVTRPKVVFKKVSKKTFKDDCDRSEADLRQWLTQKAAQDPRWQSVQSVIDFTKANTRGHRDNGELSFIHPLRVTGALARLLDQCESKGDALPVEDATNLLKTGLCHNLLENGTMTRSQLRAQVGDTVENMVFLISNSYLGDHGAKTNKSPAIIKADQVRNPLALLVKFAERSHNLITMVDIDKTLRLNSIVYNADQQRLKIEDTSRVLIPAADPLIIDQKYPLVYHAILVAGRDMLARAASRAVGRITALDFRRTVLGTDYPEQRECLIRAIRPPSSDQIGYGANMVSLRPDFFDRPLPAVKPTLKQLVLRAS